MGYPNVKIDNNTPYYAVGNVFYASILCKDDSYGVDTEETWEAKSRGLCLVTKIEAVLIIDNEDGVEKKKDPKYVIAKTYTSSGTSYSHFEIIKTEDGAFEVKRV